MNEQDVPSPVDIRDPKDAREWEQMAQERPGCAAIFRAIGRGLPALLNAGFWEVRRVVAAGTLVMHCAT